MSEAAIMENVTLSVANSDIPVLRTLSKRMGWKMKVSRQSNRERSETYSPCQYTKEEAVQRVMMATADADSGRNLVSHGEFKKQVRSWYS